MTSFEKWTGRETRALREASRMSVREFAEDLGVSARTVSNWEAGGADYEPKPVSQRDLDTMLERASEGTCARFRQFLENSDHVIAGDSAVETPPVHAPSLIRPYGNDVPELVTNVIPGTSQQIVPRIPHDNAAWEVIELIERLERSDVSASKIDLMMGVVDRLSTDYGSESADSLHPEIRGWIGKVSEAMEGRTTLAQHRELLVCAGWLFLLSGCVEYDMGQRDTAETSRLAALRIGRETGHGEIQAWAWEMSAWFALTQGKLMDVPAYVEAGQRVGDSHTIVVQLDAQLAKAAARMGDTAVVEKALESGYTKLSRMPRPDNPRNHFVIDPDKWDFYAMDAYRLLGDDARASRHAKEVLRLGQGPDGRELAPMRMAEARLTLGVSAARSGELEEAVAVGESAFTSERKSLPTLFMVANELEGELVTRYPREIPTRDYRERLVELKRSTTP